MELTYNRINGEYLGYPSCCIEAFGDVAIPFFLRDKLTQEMAKDGFLPCPTCAQKLILETTTYEELINPNRKCSIPFKPDAFTTADKVQIEKELDALHVE